ncbi:hypothetical protein HAX54_002553 [Datura stramonium]|uniref:ABC1 atypical kinase-like domain-containing protein n=1 Tax=Datura stramonium TaxID=4076 RepID=A0ABS8WRD4_DATST|nr:hypothetical protein [Datura stramonium]
MEYMEAAQVNGLKHQRLGNSARRCCKVVMIKGSSAAYVVSETFAEMMFKHGFVHCDPHAANLLVCPLSRRNIFDDLSSLLKENLSCALDHGLYKELSYNTRINYAALWKALVYSDADGIKENCVKLGAGDDLYALFAGILTMRPWNKVIDPSVDHLVVKGTDSDRSELQMYASQYFPQITELRRLPGLFF